MKQMMKTCALLLAVAFMTSGCYGPFKLTKKLHAWNGEVGGKWADEFVFLVLIWVPVYGLATLGDGLIFNSIEFWTGENPIDTASADPSGTRTKRIAKGDAEARLTQVAGASGSEFTIEQYNAGKPAESLHIRQEGGIAVASNSEGETLYTARTLADGSVVVSDPEGKAVVTHSADEMARTKESLRQ